jgi:methionyl-tRNA synthetase
LLSAGLALPTDIHVHDYLTVDGRKISKSAGTGVDPVAVADTYGTDAVRWWLVRDVPRVGDADFTLDRLDARAREDLAGGLGNVVHRVVTMIHRFRDGIAPSVPAAVSHAISDEVKDLVAAYERAPGTIDAALADAHFRTAARALTDIVGAANRCIEATTPWALAAAARNGDRDALGRLDAVLGVLLQACRVLGRELAPFLPDAAGWITAACAGVRLPVPLKVFDSCCWARVAVTASPCAGK